MSALILLLLPLTVLAQSGELVTDISPDGQFRIRYPATQLENSGTGFKRGDVPLPVQPDWQGTLERQIGGLVWGDFDGDGDLDLAVGNYHSQSYPPIDDYENQIYENVDGTLSQTPVWISGDEKSTTDVRWADVNGDSLIDLYASNGDFSLSPSVVYLNSVSGLSTNPGWTAGDNTWSLGSAFGDVDGDGDLDLAVANEGVDPNPLRPIYIFYNTGSGLETTPSWESADQVISNTVAWGDLDNSGLAADTFVTQGGGPAYMLPKIPIYSIDSVKIEDERTNDFTFDPISGWISLAAFAIPDTNVTISVFYTYLSKPDLAVAKWSNYESGVYYNQNGILNTLPGWTVGNTQMQKGIAWADYDLDGDLDLAIGGTDPTVLYENVNGTLSATPVWSSGASYHGCQDLVWGDVNRDGYPDLTTVHFANGHVRVYLNQQGMLDTTPSWYYDASSSATAVAWGDVNSDGFPDLAVGTARQPVMLFINTSDSVTAIRHSEEKTMVKNFELKGNFPNPFNPSTRIVFNLNRTSEVKLSIYDVSGELVRNLVKQPLAAGEHRVQWDGNNQSGEPVSSGIYIYRLKTELGSGSRRMLLLR